MNARVSDVMTADVITVGPELSVHSAAALMSNHGVSGLPVLDSAGHVIGIVAEGDLILRQAAPGGDSGGAASSRIPKHSRANIKRQRERPWARS